MADASHFAWPFSVVDGDIATVEQDSLEQIEQCVEVILRTPVGSRIDAPGFGRPDELFEQLGPEPSAEAFVAAVERDEPRIRLLGEASIAQMVKRITLRRDPQSV